MLYHTTSSPLLFVTRPRNKSKERKNVLKLVRFALEPALHFTQTASSRARASQQEKEIRPRGGGEFGVRASIVWNVPALRVQGFLTSSPFAWNFNPGAHTPNTCWKRIIVMMTYIEKKK